MPEVSAHARKLLKMLVATEYGVSPDAMNQVYFDELVEAGYAVVEPRLRRGFEREGKPGKPIYRATASGVAYASSI